MLILLPPSEGKSAPRRGKALDPTRLSLSDHAAVAQARVRAVDELVGLCAGDAEKAASVLGLSRTQTDVVERNASLREAPSATAASIYTGVLYSALDHASLHGAALRRVNRWVMVQSALFGLVRLTDRIPAYRLSADTSLPGLGRMSSHWRAAMDSAVPEAAGSGLVVDLRSSAYAAFWKPDRRTVALRVLHEHDGRRTVVSHFNKATKGRIVRALAEHDGPAPRTPDQLLRRLRDLGWHAEASAAGRVDVVVGEL